MHTTGRNFAYISIGFKVSQSNNINGLLILVRGEALITLCLTNPLGNNWLHLVRI